MWGWSGRRRGVGKEEGEEGGEERRERIRGGFACWGDVDFADACGMIERCQKATSSVKHFKHSVKVKQTFEILVSGCGSTVNRSTIKGLNEVFSMTSAFCTLHVVCGSTPLYTKGKQSARQNVVTVRATCEPKHGRNPL